MCFRRPTVADFILGFFVGWCAASLLAVWIVGWLFPRWDDYREADRG
jgi:hypothetical protein